MVTVFLYRYVPGFIPSLVYVPVGAIIPGIIYIPGSCSWYLYLYTCTSKNNY